MQKKNGVKPAKNPLIHLRTKLNRVDKKIIKLLGERMRLVRKVGKYKKLHNLPPLDATRWKQIEQKNASLARECNVSEQLVIDIWNRLHEEALQSHAEQNNANNS